jgi:hypothetical protein
VNTTNNNNLSQIATNVIAALENHGAIWTKVEIDGVQQLTLSISVEHFNNFSENAIDIK